MVGHSGWIFFNASTGFVARIVDPALNMPIVIARYERSAKIQLEHYV